MKTNVLLFSILACCTFTSFAQNSFRKGDILLGGGINFSSATIDETSFQQRRYTTFSILPAAGIAIRENLFVGVSLGYAYSKNLYLNSNPGYQDSVKANRYTYGIFVRKYKPLKYGFSIFLQGDFGGSNFTEKTIGQNPQYKYKGTGFGINATLTPGISYSLTHRLQLESGFSNIVQVSYNQSKSINNSSLQSYVTKSTGFNASASLSNFSSQLYVGFRLLLQKKPKAGTS